MAITNGNFLSSRGSAQDNLIFHLENKRELNEEITVTNCNRYDIQEMFNDAFDAGTKNAVFHMQFSPSLNSSSENYHLFETFLMREYNLDPADFYAVEHKKQRQLTDSGLGADTHRHYVLGVVDEATGKTRDFSFFKIRNEKLSRMFELAAGEPLTNGSHDDKTFEYIMRDDEFLDQHGANIVARADEIRELLQRDEKPQSSFDGQMKLRAEENHLSLSKIREEMKSMSLDEAAQHFKYLSEAHGLSVQIGKKPSKLTATKSHRKAKQSNQAFLVDGNGNIVLNMSRTSGHSGVKGSDWAARMDAADTENYITPEFVEPELTPKQIEARKRRERRVKETLARLDAFVASYNGEILDDRHTATADATRDATRDGADIRDDRSISGDDIKFGQHTGDTPTPDADTPIRGDSPEIDRTPEPSLGTDGGHGGRTGGEHSGQSRGDRSPLLNDSQEHNQANRSQQHSDREAGDYRQHLASAQRVASKPTRIADGGLNDEHLNPMSRMRSGRRNAWKNNARYNQGHYTLDHVIAGALLMFVGLVFKVIAPRSAIADSLLSAGRMTATGYRPPTDGQILYRMEELSEASKQKPRIAKLRLKAQAQRRQRTLDKIENNAWLVDRHRVTDKLGFFDDQFRKNESVRDAVKAELKREDTLYRKFAKDAINDIVSDPASRPAAERTLKNIVQSLNKGLSQDRINDEYQKRLSAFSEAVDLGLEREAQRALIKEQNAAIKDEYIKYIPRVTADEIEAQAAPLRVKGEPWLHHNKEIFLSMLEEYPHLQKSFEQTKSNNRKKMPRSAFNAVHALERSKRYEHLDPKKQFDQLLMQIIDDYIKDNNLDPDNLPFDLEELAVARFVQDLDDLSRHKLANKQTKHPIRELHALHTYKTLSYLEVRDLIHQQSTKMLARAKYSNSEKQLTSEMKAILAEKRTGKEMQRLIGLIPFIAAKPDDRASERQWKERDKHLADAGYIPTQDDLNKLYAQADAINERALAPTKAQLTQLKSNIREMHKEDKTKVTHDDVVISHDNSPSLDNEQPKRFGM